jgi:DNA-binding transcriptional LysR family regulator
MALDLSHLESLLVVAESGSIARAAERLNKVRSAVSYDIRCLESHLDLELLNREGYRVRLTEVGERVRREGELLLRQARALEHMAGLIAEDWEPVVQMVVEGAIPSSPVMRAIRELSTRDVPTIIALQTGFLGGVLERFERDDADLMLVKDFDAPLGDYIVHQLPEIHCVLVAAGGHAIFEGRPDSVQRHELRECLELNIQVSEEGMSHVSDKRIGLPRVLNLDGFYAKKEALLMGLGLGWMPRSLIEDELASGELAVVPLDEGHSFHFTPSLMYRKDRPLGRAGRLFRDLVLFEFESQ